MKNRILTGTLFATLTAGLLGFLLFSYIFGAGDTSFMDFAGWAYLFVSSMTHGGLIALIPFVVVWLPLALCGVRNKYSIPILAALYTAIILVAVVNRFVFQIYRFHINGFVLDMLFSEGAGDIFVLSFWMYVTAALIVAGAVLAVVILWRATRWLAPKIRDRRRFCPGVGTTWVALLLLSQGMHVYGAATLHPSILESDTFLPYYFPLSMNSQLDKWGIIDRDELATMKIEESEGRIAYPLHPLHTDSLAAGYPNIVLIAIDSWNFRTLTAECTPNLWRLKEDGEFFANHLSSSNGTRGGIFGLFTGLSSYYWKSFEYTNLKPLLVSSMQNAGYDMQVYPSANFRSPPFDRMFFKGMDFINTTTDGDTPYERDCNITRNFLADLDTHGERHFFAFLFYDLAHAIALPPERNTPFAPAWQYADYARLNNNTDPEPYFNLYRNCVYQVDSLIGIVLDSLRAKGLLDNTIVLVTGDHGQEFNENHKNYWGHSGNYSRYQIQVPMIISRPGTSPRTYTHRTTHYDVAPTLMHLALGVDNPPDDYSMGTFLTDSASRGWLIAGNDLNYAFVTEDGHIIEKQGNGYVKVYDPDLNLQPDYKPSPQLVSEYLHRLNRFYK